MTLVIRHLQADTHEALTHNFVQGIAEVQSVRVLNFAPASILLVGDASTEKVFALDLQDRTQNDQREGFRLENTKTKPISLPGMAPQGWGLDLAAKVACNG